MLFGALLYQNMTLLSILYWKRMITRVRFDAKIIKSLQPKVNKYLTNIYFNKKKKKLQDTVRKDGAKEFKHRHTKCLDFLKLSQWKAY